MAGAYSHIIDPRTGFGVAGRSSVSVIARAGMQADGLATAVSVLGADRGLALVQQRKDAELLMVVEDARGQEREVATPGLAKLLDGEFASTVTVDLVAIKRIPGQVWVQVGVPSLSRYARSRSSNSVSASSMATEL